MHNLIMLWNSAYALYSKVYVTKRVTHPTRKVVAWSSLLLVVPILFLILILITLFCSKSLTIC